MVENQELKRGHVLPGAFLKTAMQKRRRIGRIVDQGRSCLSVASWKVFISVGAMNFEAKHGSHLMWRRRTFAQLAVISLILIAGVTLNAAKPGVQEKELAKEKAAFTKAIQHIKPYKDSQALPGEVRVTAAVALSFSSVIATDRELLSCLSLFKTAIFDRLPARRSTAGSPMVT
jgi:hypothetical protein